MICFVEDEIIANLVRGGLAGGLCDLVYKLFVRKDVLPLRQ